MTKQEFEQRTGAEVNEKHFEKIHEIYMAAGDNVDKDTFCKAYKDKTDESFFIMKMMSDIINAQRAEIKKLLKRENDMEDFIIEQSEKYSSEELRFKAIEMLGDKEDIRRKVNKGYNLWELDRELLNEILK